MSSDIVKNAKDILNKQLDSLDMAWKETKQSKFGSDASNKSTEIDQLRAKSKTVTALEDISDLNTQVAHMRQIIKSVEGMDPQGYECCTVNTGPSHSTIERELGESVEVINQRIDEERVLTDAQIADAVAELNNSIKYVDTNVTANIASINALKTADLELTAEIKRVTTILENDLKSKFEESKEYAELARNDMQVKIEQDFNSIKLEYKAYTRRQLEYNKKQNKSMIDANQLKNDQLIEQYQETFKNEVKLLNDYIEKNKKNITLTEKNIALTETEIIQFQINADEQRNILTEAQTNIAGLSTKINSVETEISSMNITTEQQILTIKTSLKDAMGEFSALQKNVANLSRQASVIVQRNNKAPDVSKLIADINRLSEEMIGIKLGFDNSLAKLTNKTIDLADKQISLIDMSQSQGKINNYNNLIITDAMNQTNELQKELNSIKDFINNREQPDSLGIGRLINASAELVVTMHIKNEAQKIANDSVLQLRTESQPLVGSDNEEAKLAVNAAESVEGKHDETSTDAFDLLLKSSDIESTSDYTMENLITDTNPGFSYHGEFDDIILGQTNVIEEISEGLSESMISAMVSHSSEQNPLLDTPPETKSKPKLGIIKSFIKRLYKKGIPKLKQKVIPKWKQKVTPVEPNVVQTEYNPNLFGQIPENLQKELYKKWIADVTTGINNNNPIYNSNQLYLIELIQTEDREYFSNKESYTMGTSKELDEKSKNVPGLSFTGGDDSGMVGGAFTILAVENLTKVLLVICILLILYVLYILYNHIHDAESGKFSQVNVYPPVQCPI
jgi:hypothetical protein